MRTKIIAEVASNHGGNLKLAKEFIRQGATAGVDFVKFQSWQTKGMNPSDSQYAWFKQSELSDEAHYELKAECEKNGIVFLTTIFHADRIDFLSKLTPSILKIGSADTMNFPMLEALKKKFGHLLVSTGMAHDSEIEKTATILKETSYTLFHAVTQYPCPLDEVNMKRLDWLKKFTPSIGYSDHTIGIDAAKMAIDREATYIEKHFCLSEKGPGRVCAWDATPKMFEEIVKYSTQAEKMLGDGKLKLTPKIEEARRRFIGRFSH